MRICQKVIIKSQRQFMYGSNFYESDVMNEVIITSAAKAPLTKSFDNNRSAGMSNVLVGTSFFKYRQNNKTINMQDLERNDDCSQII